MERTHSIDASKNPLNDDAEASHKNDVCNLFHILYRFVPSDDQERRRVCRVRENVIVKQNSNQAEVQGGVAEHAAICFEPAKGPTKSINMPSGATTA
jgi:hypothetical protein